MKVRPHPSPLVPRHPPGPLGEGGRVRGCSLLEAYRGWAGPLPLALGIGVWGTPHKAVA